MLGIELRDTLIQSVVQSLQELSKERDSTETAVKYVEVTGKLDILRTLLTFLQSVTIEDSPPVVPAPAAPEAPAPPKKPKK